jgi:hypothetical protein
MSRAKAVGPIEKSTTKEAPTMRSDSTSTGLYTRGERRDTEAGMGWSAVRPKGGSSTRGVHYITQVVCHSELDEESLRNGFMLSIEIPHQVRDDRSDNRSQLGLHSKIERASAKPTKIL